MNTQNHFSRRVALFAGALLLCANLAARADDIEDANRLFKQGQRSQALEKVNAYLATRPKDAQARFLKGLIFTEQGNTAEAIKIFTSLTDDYPDLPEPYNNLAVLYASQGQYDKAKQLLEMAISTHPSYATAHENLGDIYAKMASQAYDRALQLDHSNTATQTKLAMIQNLFAGGARSKEATAHKTPVTGKVEASETVVASSQEPVPSASAVSVAAAPVAAIPAVAPVPAAPVPTAAPVPVAAPVTAANQGSSKEAASAVMAWAAAWSARDADKYLSFYANDFKTPGGEARAAWEAARRERIGTPTFIQVGVKNMNVQLTGSDHATVKFRQTYKANHMNTAGNKTLQMVKSGDRWLIQEELSR